jgi:hypothetical protein
MNNKRKKKEVRQQIKHLSSSTFTFRKTWKWTNFFILNQQYK